MNSTLVRLLYAQSKFCVEGGKVHKLFGLENKKICNIINNDIRLPFYFVWEQGWENDRAGFAGSISRSDQHENYLWSHLGWFW